MSFQIDRGLFKLDFTDHHAILGVPVDAEFKDIRKRYLRIAKGLHPDSLGTESTTHKQQANEVLSKLVNPAYEKLSQEKERIEYSVLIKLKGQQALRMQDSLEVYSELAKQLSRASDVDSSYKSAISQLAEQQYQAIDQAIELTAQISELNLIYLMRKAGKGEEIRMGTKPLATSTSSQTAGTGSQNTAGSTGPLTGGSVGGTSRSALVEQYCKRAEDLIAKNQFAKATLELRDALQIDPKYSRCHSLEGKIYLMQGNVKLAGISFDRALKFNPEDPIALDGKQRVEKRSGQASGATQKKPDPKATNSTPPGKAKPGDPKSGGGGLFGGLFGKKK